jgi:long-chain fatty acid transport protein
MRKLKAILIGVFSLMLLSSLSFGNGLNLNSLGSRAQAMGGAFVALADDFSAIYWNPAGMGFFNTKVAGVYGTLIVPKGDYSLTVPLLGQVINAETQSKVYPGGLAAFYYPLTQNLVLGLGVFTPSGLGSTWTGSDLAFLTGGTPYEWSSKIGMITIAPGLAYRINDMISVGATFNLNYVMFDISQWANEVQLGPMTYFDLGQYSEDDNGWGIGGTFGILVKPSDMFSIGATLKTPSTVSLKGTAGITNFPILGALIGLPLSQESEVKRDIDWPLQITGGLSFKPVQGLTINADVQYTAWSKLGNDQGDIVSNYTDQNWAFFMSLGGKDSIPLRWKDATQIRAGLEYMVTPVIALRAGYMYDPAPTPITTMNILLPSYDFNTITAGIGYTSGGLQVDVGFEYLMGQSRDLDFLTWFLDPATYENAMPGHFGMNILVPSFSLSYKF